MLVKPQNNYGKILYMQEKIKKKDKKQFQRLNIKKK